MRIGIDAKWFFSGHPSGKVWTRNLLRILSTSYTRHEFVFFLKDEDKAAGFPYGGRNIRLCYGSWGTNLFSNAFLLPRLVRQHSLDVFVSQNFAVPFCRTRQVCVVFDVIFESHPEFFRRRERMYFRMIRPLLFFADHVVTISEQSKRDLDHFGYTNARRSASVIYLGVDGRFHEASRMDEGQIRDFRIRWRLPDDFVLYVGRFNTRKNIQGLLKAFSLLASDRHSLVLCGAEDGKSASVERLISEMNLGSRVRVLAGVTDEDLPLLYRSASLFAYPSFKEGFGLPPLEAMACGTPVVAANTSSLPEVCGDAAEYVDPFNADDIRRGLELVLTNDARRKAMVEKGQARARELTWTKTAAQFMDILHAIVTSP